MVCEAGEEEFSGRTIILSSLMRKGGGFKSGIFSFFWDSGNSPHKIGRLFGVVFSFFPELSLLSIDPRPRLY